jgi:hypothetical protein
LSGERACQVGVEAWHHSERGDRGDDPPVVIEIGTDSALRPLRRAPSEFAIPRARISAYSL